LKYLIALCLLSVTAGFCHAETAEEMVSACREVSAARITGDNAYFPETFQSGLCWGSFGVTQTIIAAMHSSGPHPDICLPGVSNRTQLIAIFLEYMKRNPKRYNEDFLLVALDATREAFPCREPQKR
jgi:hypothetical protein